MKFEIVRTKRYGETVMGQLLADGGYVADTCENANEMLPTGTYTIGITKVGKKVAYVGTVKGRSRQIGTANGVYGKFRHKIMVGKAVCPGCLIDTQNHYNRLFERLRKATARGTTLTVEIKERLTS